MRLDLVPIAHHTESRPLSSSNLARGNEGARPLLEPILGQERLELCLKLGAVDEYRVAVPLVERLARVGEKESILTILNDQIVALMAVMNERDTRSRTISR
jgi:hypothetical protein